VVALAAHFAKKHAERLNRTITRIDARGLRALAAHPWPGNVRELENVIERAVILSHGGTLRIDRESLPSADVPAAALADQLRANERQAIEEALAASHGRVSGPHGAARRLGLAPSTLEFRIRKLGIDKFAPRKRAPTATEKRSA
jgi:formate hydrogenlyase transcriptional activator